MHIFPEGGRSRDGGKTIGALKRGIGRYFMLVVHNFFEVESSHFHFEDEFLLEHLTFVVDSRRVDSCLRILSFGRL